MLNNFGYSFLFIPLRERKNGQEYDTCLDWDSGVQLENAKEVDLSVMV